VDPPSRNAPALARFVAVVSAPVVALADGAFCIAECARSSSQRVADTPGTDTPVTDMAASGIDVARRELDRIAAAVADESLEGVIDTLRRFGFAGDTEHYDDPRNSLLDMVLLRRRGIPITLSVVAIDVARRRGVEVLPIGMPGHFLVRSATDPECFADPFHGRVLDRSECATIFRRLFGPQRTLGPDDLEPVAATAVLARMLNNLEAGALGRNLESLAWMVDLHAAIPNLSPGDRVALATRLELLGRYHDAAKQIDEATAFVSEEVRPRLAARATTYRARYN
jgi:regulator of sirC expression with transglutaminase-like and TPR domain